jgi:hypothetical protein
MKAQTAEPIADEMTLRGVRRAPAQAASRETRSNGTEGRDRSGQPALEQHPIRRDRPLAIVVRIKLL